MVSHVCRISKIFLFSLTQLAYGVALVPLPFTIIEAKMLAFKAEGAALPHLPLGQ